MNLKIITLQPPLLDDHHIQEKITCVRGHRERIFFVHNHMYNGKHIFHNYGHGGAGYTFLFGCVQQSLQQFEHYHTSTKQPPNAVVLGAGCYGLLTAIELARRNIHVRIVAKDLENIPSHNAAGFFFPRWRTSSTQEEKDQFLSCGLISYKTYLDIIAQHHPFLHSGAQLLPAFYDPSIDPGFAPYCAQQCMNSPQSVQLDFGTGKQYKAQYYHTLFINVDALMAELWRNVKELGIPIEQRFISAFDELEEPIIFNCAGFGARELTQDPRIIPVQGHLITLKNQPIQQLHYLINWQYPQLHPRGYVRKEPIYFAPKREGILGITFLRGQDGTARNEQEFDRILERARQFFGT